MYKGKILLIDDETSILEFLSYNFLKEGYEVMTADNGMDGVSIANERIPDLILLDRMMAGMDGIEVLKRIRQNAKLDHTIVIYLTALGDEKSEIEGLENGADDYVSKPIKPDLLLTRVQTALRRQKVNQNSEVEDESVIQFENIIINKDNYSLSIDGKDIGLAKKEFELLALLASKPGRVFLRNEILNRVWGTEVIVGDRTIDVHIRKIRQKMGVDAIKTIKGVGYKFEV